MNPRFLLLGLALLLAACNYEFPITAEPSRKIDESLVGTWLGEKPEDTLEVRKFDDFHYVVATDGQFYSAYHSDLGGTPFVNVQWIDPIDAKERKFWFATYELADGGNKLIVRGVREKVVPKTAKSSEEIASLIKANLKTPELFDEAATFTRKKK